MKIANEYAWSTHAPMNNVLIKLFNPRLIVEMGTGLHSTPLFLESSAEKLFFIENDLQWIDHVKSNFSFDDRCDIIYQSLGDGIVNSTKNKKLSQEKRLEISNYYKNFATTIDNIDMSLKFLFVDHFTCARTSAINNLFESFDVIVYHDCEPAGVTWYEYTFSELLYQNYDNFILTSPAAWTGCFVKKSLNIESTLKTNIIPFIEEYCKKHNIDSNTMKLING
jgi:hypothetical protein